MKQKKKAKLKQTKGITLIALVITIIVLLILAAVSVSTLTGENGILTKANKAKEDTQMAAAKEKVQMAVLASYDSNGDLDITTLKTELRKIGSNIFDTNGGFPVTVTVDDYTFVINNEGKVTSQDGNSGGSETEEVYTIEEKYLEFDESTGAIGLKEAYSYYDWDKGTTKTCELGKSKIRIPETYHGQAVKKVGLSIGSGIEHSTFQGFRITDVEEIILPEGVEKVEDFAFDGCNNLQTISLPNSIKEIRCLFFSCLFQFKNTKSSFFFN